MVKIDIRLEFRSQTKTFFESHKEQRRIKKLQLKSLLQQINNQIKCLGMKLINFKSFY